MTSTLCVGCSYLVCRCLAIPIELVKFSSTLFLFTDIMENQYENIANINLLISESCSEENKNIIKVYWEQESTELLNTPKLIKQRLNLSQSELSTIINTHSSISLYLLCENCNSYEKHKATSQSKFREIINLQKNRYNKYKCDYCKEEQRKQINLEEQQKKDELIRKLDKAVYNKNWENLSNFERAILGNCLEMNFNQLKHHYGRLLGQGNFYKLIRGLDAIENQDLIVLKRDSYNGYVKSYQIENRLREYKEEIVLIDEVSQSSVEIDSATNEIKFKLTINENQQHPDQPMYAGTVTFKERIVIEPGVEYIFGQWHRAKKNLYLTMIPIANLEKSPIQKRISKLPISLQKGVHDFLNNMSKNNSFE
jgi:hypothetical protein